MWNWVTFNVALKIKVPISLLYIILFSFFFINDTLNSARLGKSIILLCCNLIHCKLLNFVNHFKLYTTLFSFNHTNINHKITRKSNRWKVQTLLIFAKTPIATRPPKHPQTQLTNNPSQKSPKFALFTVHVRIRNRKTQNLRHHRSPRCR